MSVLHGICRPRTADMPAVLEGRKFILHCHLRQCVREGFRCYVILQGYRLICLVLIL